MKTHFTIPTKTPNVLNCYAACGLVTSLSGLLRHREENEINIVKQWDMSSDIKQTTCKKCKETLVYRENLKTRVVARLTRKVISI